MPRKSYIIQIINKSAYDHFLKELREWQVPNSHYLKNDEQLRVATTRSNVVDVCTESLKPDFFNITKV